MKSNALARARLIFCMAVWGTLGLFVRNISVSSQELALYRALLALMMIGGYLIATRQRISIKALGRELPLLFGSGVAIGINWILLFEAYRYTTVSVATLSYYFAPVIVIAVSFLLFREPLSLRQVLCFVGSTAGLILIIRPQGLDSQQGKSHLVGILLGLGAAVFYAGVILLNKSIRNVDGVRRTLLQFIAAVIVLIPYILLTSGFHLSALDAKGWISLLIVGLLHTGITYCLYFSSLKDVRGQQAAILSYIDPLVAVVVSVTLLGESIAFSQLIGGALMLGLTLLNELSPNPNPTSNPVPAATLPQGQKKP